MLKKGYITLELVILTAIIVIAGVTGYMVFAKNARKNLDTSKGILSHSVDAFNTDTKTKDKQ